MNDNLRIKKREAAPQQTDIFLHIGNVEGVCFIKRSQVCPFENVEKLKFDSLYMGTVQISDRFKHLAFGLSRQEEDYMDNRLDPDPAEIFDRGVKYIQGISPADKAGGIFVDRLQPQFYPHRFDPVQTIQQCEHIVSQTVRACSDGKDLNVRIRNRLGKDLFQIFHRRVGIGEGLKIRDVGSDRTFGKKLFLPGFELAGNRHCSGTGKISGSFCAAEDASACAGFSVPVGTGHSAVQCDLIYFFPVSAPQSPVQRMITFFLPSVWSGPSDRSPFSHTSDYHNTTDLYVQTNMKKKLFIFSDMLYNKHIFEVFSHKSRFRLLNPDTTD